MRQHLLSIFLIAFLASTSLSFGDGETAFANKQPKGLALVLSGGGARGLAQIGVLQVLDSLGIKPNMIVSTSMGSLVGSLYACGWSGNEIDSISRLIDWNNALSNSAKRPDQLVSQKREPTNSLFEMRFGKGLKPILPNAISNGQAIYDAICPLTAGSVARAGGDFDKLPIPLRVVTTDILTGESVVFGKGDLAEIVRASCAIPLAISPVNMGNRILVDGGLTANIPVEPALALGSFVVLAIDVTSPLHGRDQLDNPVYMIDQVIAINIDRQKRNQRGLADLLIVPELEGKRNTDFHNIDSLIACGKKAAIESIPKLLEIKQKIIPQEACSSKTVSVKFYDSCINRDLMDSIRNNIMGLPTNIVADTIISFLRESSHEPFALSMDSLGNINIGNCRVRKINVIGNSKTSSRHIEAASNLRPDDQFCTTLIKQTLLGTYATGLFETVGVSADSTGEMSIKVVEKNYIRLRLGLRMDEYNGLEGYIEPGHENILGTGTRGLLHLQYGPTRQKYALEISTSQPWNLWWANTVALQAYISKESLSKRLVILDTSNTATDIISYDEVTLEKTGLFATAGAPIGRVFMIDGGVRIENFNVAKADQSTYSDPVDGAYRNGMSSFIVRLAFDNIDQWPFPKNGQKAYFSLGGASALSSDTARYINFQINIEKYASLNATNSFGIQAFCAFADRHLPPVAQVYLGGHPPTDRFSELTVYARKPFSGLKPNAIPCDVAVLFRGQYRVNPVKNIFLTLDLDWGYGWQQNSEFPGSFKPTRATAKDLASNALVGLGIDFTVKTIAGPINLGIGKVIAGTLDSRFGIDDPGIVYYLSAGHDF